MTTEEKKPTLTVKAVLMAAAKTVPLFVGIAMIATGVFPTARSATSPVPVAPAAFTGTAAGNYGSDGFIIC